MGTPNTTLVKYIHLKVAAGESGINYHEVKDYELATKNVEHRAYGELHSKTRFHCPSGYRCIEPLALYHEVVWTTNSERDVLHHAIEEQEYSSLWVDGTGPRSICVDVVQFNKEVREY
jgi:hypothetical protein